MNDYGFKPPSPPYQRFTECVNLQSDSDIQVDTIFHKHLNSLHQQIWRNKDHEKYFDIYTILNEMLQSDPSL